MVKYFISLHYKEKALAQKPVAERQRCKAFSLLSIPKRINPNEVRLNPFKVRTFEQMNEEFRRSTL
jgi:hypothetical protein